MKKTIEEEIAELRAVTREAHEAMKDLNSLMRLAENKKRDLREAIEQIANASVNEVFNDHAQSWLRGQHDRLESSADLKIQVMQQMLGDFLDARVEMGELYAMLKAAEAQGLFRA